MDSLFEPSATDDRRSDDRQFLDLPLVLLESTRVSEFVQIVNLASRGFLARSRLFFRTGDLVYLSLPGADRAAARVVWFERGMVGAQFVTAITDSCHSAFQPERSSATAASRSNK